MSAIDTYPVEYLVNEASSLIVRIQMMKPFSMSMPMVRGAFISNEASKGVTELLEKGKTQLYHDIKEFIKNAGKDQQWQDPERLQMEFTFHKLRFNSVLDQLDIFADVLSQRAEHDVGIWLSGLDALAEDGLKIGEQYYVTPPLMVFLERGHGAAIRSARTRLPGGDQNPVAVIQIPRERMIGSGIASSLIHETGHQAAKLLDLVPSLRKAIGVKKSNSGQNIAYHYFDRWISEIIADYWAIGQLGITSALGLTGVVTLPKYFQFRLDLEDPHPAPYVRVQISCAFGNALYPHPQWNRVWNLWKVFYPIDRLPPDTLRILKEIENELPEFVKLVNEHQPKALKGKSLAEIFPLKERQPRQLQELYRQWEADHHVLDSAPPTLFFSVVGQAKADLLLSAEGESKILTRQLRQWAYNRNQII